MTRVTEGNQVIGRMVGFGAVVALTVNVMHRQFLVCVAEAALPSIALHSQRPITAEFVSASDCQRASLACLTQLAALHRRLTAIRAKALRPQSILPLLPSLPGAFKMFGAHRLVGQSGFVANTAKILSSSVFQALYASNLSLLLVLWAGKLISARLAMNPARARGRSAA